MIHKFKSPLPGHVRVVFELPSSVWADRICLTGEFNNWSEHETPMVQERDGAWRATLDLPADRFYEFRYLVDGKWQTDGRADSFPPKMRGIPVVTRGMQSSIVHTQLA
jgi:1,4-alpha-glucan branching enzyme